MMSTTTLRRRLAAVAAALVLPALVPSPAAGDPIADRRVEAARLAREIERLGERLSMLDESFNESRLRLGAAEQAVAASRAKTEETERRHAAVLARARDRAVAAYVDGGMRGSAILLPTSANVTQLSLRREYLRLAAGDDREVLDALRVAREDLESERAGLDRRLSAARAAAEKVAAARRAAAGAMADQRRLLARSRGELDRLVRAEEARRAELAARRAPSPRAERSRPTVSTSPVASPPASSGAAAAVAFARQQVGKPYQWGAAGPDSYDCSGLTMASWRQGGVSLPHSSRAQYSATTRVPMSDLQPGDLLFYGSPIHHVGIYVGGGQMIAAPQSGRRVEYQSIARRDLVGAGRPS